MEYVIYAFIGLNIALFGVSLIALARVGQVRKATSGLDWDAVARLTGDVATIKKNIQSQNNRLNGMMERPLKRDDVIVQMHQQLTPEQLHGG